MDSGRFGIACDIGTSRLEGALVDISRRRSVSFRSVVNDQRLFGPDVISRLAVASSGPSGLARLSDAALAGVRRLIRVLLDDARVEPGEVGRILCVGNSAMHHLVLSLPPEALARSPFAPSHVGKVFRCAAGDIGLSVCGNARFEFLPNLGGFVGSDALAVMVACGMPSSRTPILAVDIGTNGEVMLGDASRSFVASTSAGPAFEGWHFSCGMPAVEGAVESVRLRGGRLIIRTIGGVRPKGICGSGLIDAVQILVDLGIVDRTGRMRPSSFRVCPGVVLTRRDVREVQLAKAAIQAAVKVLRRRYGPAKIGTVVLAGRFGALISKASARSIGILPGDAALNRVRALRHGALDGAKMIIASPRAERTALEFCRRTVHVELHAEKSFQDEFVAAMRF